MFVSISVADPNTTVTSSFTAIESCTVGVPDGSTVRVNGQVVSARPINLAVNDKIELDVLSAGPDAHKFVNWTYNGVPSWFAVVSSAGSAKPRLKSMYRGKNWLDFSPAAKEPFSYMNAGGDERILQDDGSDNGFQTADISVVVDYQNYAVHFYRPADGARIYKLILANKPLSHTSMWNGTNNSWESYILDDKGYISRYDSQHNLTRSSATYPNGRTLFTDGTTLYVAGPSYLVVLSDINTIGRTYTTTENIQAGVAIADVAIVTTASGKAYRLNTSSLDLIHSTSMIGQPAAFQNFFILPLTDEYKLRILNSQGVYIGDINTGNLLPWAVNTWRDSRMAVAGADSKDVYIYSDIVTSPKIRTFSKKVTFAVPTGDSVFVSHYLQSFQLTIPPNPKVGNLNLNQLVAPIGVATGTGEYSIVTEGENLTCFASPNVTMLVNGDTSNLVINNGSLVQMYQTSYDGRASAAIVIGNYAFDSKVIGLRSSSFSTFVNPGVKTKANQLVWSFRVPRKVVNAPIALSVGTLQVDGSTFNGQSLVNEGQQLTITINVPANATYYHSVLSIADAQYPLIMSVSANKDADIQRFQPYGSTEVMSTFQVSEDGLYDFPTYKNAYVMKDDQILSFPTTLANGDMVTVRHIQASSWWLDERDTVLIGPSINYFAKSFTTVNDRPSNVDFGRVHKGIPDFDFEGDLTPVISGLSDEYQIVIFADHMKFSVNGGPYLAQPLVKNGDKVKALYTVQNLFDQQFAKTLLADNVTVYEFGYLNIDPALGQLVPEPEVLGVTGMDQWDKIQTHIEEQNANIPEVQQIRDIYMDANTPELQQIRDIYMDANIPEVQRIGAPVGVASIPFWFQGQALPGLASVGLWQSSAAQRRANLNSGLFSREPLGRAPQSVPGFVLENIFIGRRLRPGIPNQTNYLFSSRPYIYQAQPQSIRLADGTNIKYIGAIGVRYSYVRYLPGYRVYTPAFVRYKDPGSRFEESKPDKRANVAWRNMSMPRLIGYYAGWRYMGGPIGRTYGPKWIDHTPKNFPIYNPGYNHMTYVTRAADHDAIWMQSADVRFKQNQGEWFIQPEYRSAKNYGFVSPSLHLTFGKDTGFFQTSFAKASNVPEKPKMASVSFGPMPRSKEVVASEATYRPPSVVVIKPHWETFLPLKTGGFATAVEAEQSAIAYNNTLPHQVYQQPEGTFSYVFKRNTELVCHVKNTTIYATKWLIGGG